MDKGISENFNTKSLLFFVLPCIVMMVFVAVYSMTGSIFASKYIGQNAMSAINIVQPIFALVFAIAVMFAAGSNAIISKNMGEDKPKEARENFTVIFLAGLAVGIVFMAAVLIFMEPLILFLGATPELCGYCREYLSVYAFAIPIIFLQVYAQYYFVTVGKQIFGMVIVIVGGISCIVLNYILMVTFEIGIRGAAIASIVSFAVPGTVFIVYFLVRKNCALHFVMPKRHKNFMLKTCTNGSSEMITNFSLAIITATFNIIMIKLRGTDGIAAASVITQTKFMFDSVYIGFVTAIIPVFGYAYGAKNRKQTKEVFRNSIKFITVVSVVMVVLSIICAGRVTQLFISPASSAFALGKQGFTIFACGYLFAGYNFFASGFFTAVSNGRISALIAFLRTFVFIMSMLLILPQILNVTGVWISIPLAEILAFIVTVTELKKYRKVYHY